MSARPTLFDALLDEPGAWMDRPFLCLDFETTGTDPHEARPVSVAAAVLDPDGTHRGEAVIVDAGVDVPEDTIAVHGITAERIAAEGLPASEVCGYLVERAQLASIEGWPVVMFNARYDWTLLHTEAARHGLKIPECFVIDPFVVDKHLDKYRKGKRSLVTMSAHYGIALNDAHTALADAICGGELARHFGVIYPTVAMSTLAQLHALQADWYESWRVGFNDYLRRQGSADVVAPGWPIA